MHESNCKYHTNIVTGDRMRYVVIIKSKIIHSLEQGATSYVLEFYQLYLKNKGFNFLLNYSYKSKLPLSLYFLSAFELYPKIHLQLITLS